LINSAPTDVRDDERDFERVQWRVKFPFISSIDLFVRGADDDAVGLRKSRWRRPSRRTRFRNDGAFLPCRIVEDRSIIRPVPIGTVIPW
jgi:hypothetical protein